MTAQDTSHQAGRRGITPVGFIGLGRMGSAMALRLQRQGFAVIGCDPDPHAHEPLLQAGGRVAGSPRAVADEAALVIGCLPSAEVCAEVLFGTAGVVHGRAVRTYVESSTLGRAALVDFEQGLQAAGVGLVDAPVSGGPAGAEAGTLACVVAGAPQALSHAREAIAAYAATLVEAGAHAGLAQVFKLVNQGITFASFLLAAEAISAGTKAGADPQRLLDFLNASTARNWSTAVKFPENVLPRRFGPGNLDVVRKDMALYLAMCAQTETPCTLGQEAGALFERADRELPPPVDLGSAVRLYETAPDSAATPQTKEQ